MITQLENEKPLKIGSKYISYSKVPYDEDGWADASKFIPEDFDLCLLKIRDKKTKFGWVQGSTWEGLKVKKEDQVLYWKKSAYIERGH